MPTIENQYPDSVPGPELPASPGLGGAAGDCHRLFTSAILAYSVGLLLAVPFGALYLFLTPATYTASALTLIETRKNPLEPLRAAVERLTLPGSKVKSEF